MMTAGQAAGEAGSEEARSGLCCCLCLHALPGVAAEADTVINGQAVCCDHMGYVQGGLFTQALARLLEEMKGSGSPDGPVR